MQEQLRLANFAVQQEREERRALQGQLLELSKLLTVRSAEPERQLLGMTPTGRSIVGGALALAAVSWAGWIAYFQNNVERVVTAAEARQQHHEEWEIEWVERIRGAEAEVAQARKDLELERVRSAAMFVAGMTLRFAGG